MIPLNCCIVFARILGTRLVRAASSSLWLGQDLLVYLVSLDFTFLLLEKHVQQFVYVTEIETHVELSALFPLYQQNFGQCSMEGVQEEKELISVDFSLVLKPEDVDYCFQVSLV